MSAAVLALLAVGSGIAGAAAWREGRGDAVRRRAMLDDCAGTLDGATKTIAADGFPRLAGSHEGRHLRVGLVPDTLAPKRLPQLWLVVTLPIRVDVPALAVTARPRGDDFISQAGGMRRHLRVPPWLPCDCGVRGGGAEAEAWLEAARRPLSAAFADPRLKEVTIGPAGLRLVYQACEGQRGAHLLLRQARFATPVERAALLRCVATLRAVESVWLRTVVITHSRREAA